MPRSGGSRAHDRLSGQLRRNANKSSIKTKHAAAPRLDTAAAHALVKPEPPKAKSLHLTSFLCEACGGNHWWGHGNGYAGGTHFRCDNPKCKRAVPKVSTEEAETRMANCPHCIGEKMYHASPDSFASKSAAYCAAAEILDEACTVNDAWALGL